jgi:chromosomal replication initiation ATPase DnaA
MFQDTISQDTTDDLLEADHDPQKDRLAAGLVTSLVALSTGVPPREIAARTRARAEAARARQVAMYLTHTSFSWTITRTAAAFGRDRTTASHACSRVEDLREDAEFDARLTAMEACLRHVPAFEVRA